MFLLNFLKKLLTIFCYYNNTDSSSEFATNIIYYGNHLYHHDIPVLMSESALLNSFQKNKKELKIFPNYKNLKH